MSNLEADTIGVLHKERCSSFEALDFWHIEPCIRHLPADIFDRFRTRCSKADVVHPRSVTLIRRSARLSLLELKEEPITVGPDVRLAFLEAEQRQ